MGRVDRLQMSNSESESEWELLMSVTWGGKARSNSV